MSDVRKPDARETALEVLMQVDSAERMVRWRPKRTIAKNKLDSRDAALATRLCYGVIQNRMLLDYYIGCWCSQRPERLAAVIRNILRLGGYQILLLDKVPPACRRQRGRSTAAPSTPTAGNRRRASSTPSCGNSPPTGRRMPPQMPQGPARRALSLRSGRRPVALVEQSRFPSSARSRLEAYLRADNQVRTAD